MGGLLHFHSSPKTICVIPPAWLSNRGICAKNGECQRNLPCKWFDQEGHCEVFLSEAYVKAALLKPCVDSEVTKHLASASQPSAEPNKPVESPDQVGNQLWHIRVEVGVGTQQPPPPPLCWSYHAQRWIKSVPNPEAAQGRLKPKSKGIFLKKKSYPLLTLFPPLLLLLLLLSRAGSRKLLSKNTSAFNYEGGSCNHQHFNSVSRTI